MKRKKNFLLFVWAAALWGLFTVQVSVQAAHPNPGFYVPVELAMYETKCTADTAIRNDSLVALLSAETFDENTTSYNLTSAYKSRKLLLGFNWKRLPGTENLPDSIAAPVKVYFNDVEAPKYGSTRSFGTYYSDVYVISFGSELDAVSGKVEVDLSAIAQGTKTYSATVKRGEVDDITSLRRIWVTDSITNVKTDTIFDKKAGEDGKLVAESNWNISFKAFNQVQGRAKADTLYFEKYDALSTVHVIKNDRDTLKSDGDSPAIGAYGYTRVDEEIYKVKIQAGNKYTIAVTARDSITRGYYYITLLDDTVKTLPSNTDSLNYMLKDLWLYEKVGDDSISYPISAINSGKVGFNHDTLQYKVTAPRWRDIKVGYEAWTDSFDIYKKEVLILTYTKGEEEKFIEVRVTVPEDSTRLKNEGRKGGRDTTYVIRVFSNDNFLKDLHLSYDEAGKDTIALTAVLSDTVINYKSVDVDWKTPYVYVWATTRDGRAKVDSLIPTNTPNEYKKTWEFKKEPGVEETFSIPVRAEDSTLIKNYTVTVRRKWDPNLKSVTFSSGDWTQLFITPVLEQGNTFDIKVPANVDYENITPAPEYKDKNYYRVPTTLKSVGDQYSYVIKVASVDRKEESKADKTYTFNLFHKSNDAHLKLLSVTPGGELSPAFDSDIFEYSVRVPHTQDHIYFVAQTRDALASANVGGKRDLEVGEQTFSIVVTAENGEKTETYTVKVIRESATGILPTGVSAIQVHVSGQSLHVSTPAAERVSVYSAGGQLLYSLDKQSGKTSVSGLPKGILIVKGSSRWVEKRWYADFLWNMFGFHNSIF